MARRPAASPQRDRNTQAAKSASAFVDDLVDEARAASGERQRAILDHIETVLLTDGRPRHRGLKIRLVVAADRQLLLKKARQFGFDEKRGKPLEEFAQSHMRGEVLDDGTLAAEYRADLV